MTRKYHPASFTMMENELIEQALSGKSDRAAMASLMGHHPANLRVWRIVDQVYISRSII